jgi:KDO2-lipid IV(A) lauroyltransferase
MTETRASTLTRWMATYREAGSLRRAVRWLGEYAAIRLWTFTIGCFPVETNLKTARLLGSVWWLLMRRHRVRAMDNLRPALGGHRTEQELWRIARRSFEHFAQVYLVEMAMTPRLVTEWTWARYVQLHDLAAGLRQLLSGSGTIMLTAHFGNYELMGFTIAKLGFPLTAIMRPLDNPLLNELIERPRKSGGLSLVYKKGAMESAESILEEGGTLCFIADQDAGRKGVFADFFGRGASWYKSIGLLAMHKRVPIVVGQAARVRSGFHYRVEILRIIRPEEWDAQADPLRWITQSFARAMEEGIRRYPEQYLWMHRRWKTRPKGEDSDSRLEVPACSTMPRSE